MAWPEYTETERLIFGPKKIFSHQGGKDVSKKTSQEVILKMLCFEDEVNVHLRPSLWPGSEHWGRLSGPLLGDHNNAKEKVFPMYYHSITQ